ncbi:putative hydro-lyase [Corynebacterium ulceribovis]|uniref:putative hydro-lyase n=1 Tax=Corynebacterium ulceribovis TaxID=487732 RepID=UPI0003A0FE26|nr:putative hydro-lyase [Corynebacterium ulceribovis]
MPHPAHAMTPAAARAQFRAGLVDHTSGYSAGYAQANLLAVPKDYAFDFLLFAQRNPKPCPILGVLEAGQYNSELLPGGDIRTDIPKYRVFKEGELIDEISDASNYWRDDLVSFLIGCSFTFEGALQNEGISIAHIDQGRNVPMYRTNIDCAPAGVFRGKKVVSMRPIPASQVADAVRITSRYPAVHGAPIHVGDPAAIGITDINQPDYGEAVDIPAGTIPVFWACGVTPQSVVMESRPSLAISHAPGYMLVTDVRDLQYQVP